MVTWSPSHITLEGLRIDPADVVQFLAVLATCGNVSRACRISRVSRPTVYRLRQDVPEFREAFEHAMSCVPDMLEEEAWRRAVVGVQRPVFHGGKIVGAVKDYSDRLLTVMLQARHPEYRRTVGGGVSVGVNTTVAAGSAAAQDEGPAPPSTVELLSGIEKLREIAAESVQVLES